MTRIVDVALRRMRTILRAYSFEQLGPKQLTDLLIDAMHYADATPGVSWSRCIEAASKQYAKEVREAADETPLPEK